MYEFPVQDAARAKNTIRNQLVLLKLDLLFKTKNHPTKKHHVVVVPRQHQKVAAARLSGDLEKLDRYHAHWVVEHEVIDALAMEIRQEVDKDILRNLRSMLKE